VQLLRSFFVRFLHVIERNMTTVDIWETQSKGDWMWSWTIPHVTSAAAHFHELQPGARVLDVGCGTGSCCVPLAQRYKDKNIPIKIFAIDISPAMVKRTKELSQELKLDSIITCSVMDAMKIDVPDNNFDLITCMFIWDAIPNPQKPHILSEFYRVLKPVGLLVISSWRKLCLVEMLPLLSKKTGSGIDLLDEIQDMVYNMAEEEVIAKFCNTVGFKVKKFHQHAEVPPLRRGDMTAIRQLQEHPIAGPLFGGKSTLEVSKIIWDIFDENPHLLEPASNTSVSTFAVKPKDSKL